MTRQVAPLRCVVEPGHPATVVRIAGEIDMYTESALSDAVSQAMGNAAPVIVLDLADVTFMGTAGLHVLVATHHDTQVTGRALRIVDGAGAAHRSIEISGLEQVLALYESVDDARSEGHSPRSEH
jgi:anti-anti-sigma factor